MYSAAFILNTLHRLSTGNSNMFHTKNHAYPDRDVYRKRIKILQHACTGRERLIRSHSSARFSFKLSGNSN